MLPEWVNDYVGMPFKLGGRDREGGVDCFGLCLLVWREVFGLNVPSYGGVAWGETNTAEVGAFIAGEVRAGWEPVPDGEEQPGNVVVMRMRGHPIHVGVVVAPGWMLHCHELADAAVENYRSLQWAKRIIGFYRYRND